VVQSVQGLIGIASNDLQTAQTCAFQNEVWQSLPVLAQQAGAVLARTALSLRAEQIAHLRQYHEEDNIKWREEWLDGPEDERLQRRLKRALERIEARKACFAKPCAPRPINRPSPGRNASAASATSSTRSIAFG
jgi:hypothetical protein